MVYVMLCGPKVAGVFDGAREAMEMLSKMAKVPTKNIEIKDSYSGDLLLLIDGYIQGRLVKTTYY